MRSLLDVNVLIALLDAAHLHHALATRWLKRELRHGWASCPITQSGCVRVMSQPAYPGALPVGDVAARLGDAASGAAHAFWPDDLNLLDGHSLQWTRVLGHRQVTDAYLLALAVRHGGRLASFDRRISVDAVPGAQPQHLVIIG